MIMKTTIFLSLAMAICLISSTQKTYGQIEGAWRLVYLKAYTGDSLLYQFPSKTTTINQIKMWSKDHFMFVGQYVSDTVTDDAYGAGTYTLKGKAYEEQILYHSTVDWIGTGIKMYLEIKEDTLIQIFPVNDQGEVVTNYHAIEKYIRY